MLDKLLGLRIDPSEQAVGLDIAEYGETADVFDLLTGQSPGSPHEHDAHAMLERMGKRAAARRVRSVTRVTLDLAALDDCSG